MIEPTHRDVPYGTNERQVVDVYLAESKVPAPVYIFIHGGGFKSGDKANAPQGLLERCLPSGISVAAVNYRLSGTDPYPAAMEDSVRAIQFIRHKAKDWNLDPTRVAAGGGSAGGGITFWIGFRPDFAEPESDDAVVRQSTRLTCIASWNTQSSYDPNFIRTIISGEAYKHEALQQFFRVTPDEYDSPRAKKMFEEASAINHVTKNAPPTFIWYSRSNLPMTDDLSPGDGIHHPKFGQILKEKMDELGVECIVHGRNDYPDVPDEEFETRFYVEVTDFLKKRLLT